jgi:hypothetical protein
LNARLALLKPSTIIRFQPSFAQLKAAAICRPEHRTRQFHAATSVAQPDGLPNSPNGFHREMYAEIVLAKPDRPEYRIGAPCAENFSRCEARKPAGFALIVNRLARLMRRRNQFVPWCPELVPKETSSREYTLSRMQVLSRRCHMADSIVFFRALWDSLGWLCAPFLGAAKCAQLSRCRVGPRRESRDRVTYNFWKCFCGQAP